MVDSSSLDESKKAHAAAFVVILLFPCLSTIAVALRIASKCITRLFGADDVLILIAWLLAVGDAAAVYMFTVTTYQGYHVVDIPTQTIDQQILGQRYNLANQLLYHPILATVKASAIIFLLRIGDMRKRIDWSLKGLFVFNILFLISTFLADLYQCSPLHYVYDYPAMDLAAQKAANADRNGMLNGKLVKGGTCIHQVAFFLATAGLTILTDVAILLIPMLMVKDLQMHRRKKIVLLAILSMGWVVTAVSTARLAIYAHRFSPDNMDRTYGFGYTISGVEANLAIITACAPALNGLTRRVRPRFLSSDRSKNYSKQRSYAPNFGGRSHPLGSRGAANHLDEDGYRSTFDESRTDKEREYRTKNMQLGVPTGWDSEERIVGPLDSSKSFDDVELDHVSSARATPPYEGIVRTIDYSVRVQVSR